MSKVKEKKEQENQIEETKESIIEMPEEKTQEAEIILENTDTETIPTKLEETTKEIETIEGTSNQEETVEKIETIEEIVQQEEKKDWIHRYAFLIAIIAVILLIAGILFSTIFGFLNRKSNTIVSGVFIQGIDLSKLTKQEAQEKVMQMYNQKNAQNICLKHGEYETSLTPEQIQASFKLEEAVDMAYSIGRSGKILKDNYAILNAGMNKIEIKPGFSYNEQILTDFISNISANLPDKVQQSNYEIEGNNLIIHKGKAGASVEIEELKQQILNHIVELKSEGEILEIPSKQQEPNTIDLEAIHKEIYQEAQNAYFTKEPFVVHPHVQGVDFAISLEEAKQALENQEEVTIPLKITTPQITTNQIGTEAFPNLLASYTTSFSTSNSNRTTNIRLSSNKINGVVVLPNQQFSYNTVVGKRTVQAGYKSAPTYVGGKVVDDIGGGICQVSSTLYNTVLRANLEIVKRSNHRFATGYVPLSTDATVSWGGPEFIFKNSRKYPIKIVSTITGGKIKIDIYGCKEEVEYEVQIKSETLQTIPMKTTYRTNTNLAKGTQKIVQKGHGGYKSRAYRILSLNGKVISKQLLSTDTYAQLERIIEKN